MKIRLLRNTVADGQQVSAGAVVTVSDAAGQTLVQMGKAQRVIEAQPIETQAEPADDQPVVADPTTADPIEAEPVAPAPPKKRKGKG